MFPAVFHALASSDSSFGTTFQNFEAWVSQVLKTFGIDPTKFNYFLLIETAVPLLIVGNWEGAIAAIVANSKAIFGVSLSLGQVSSVPTPSFA